MMYIAASLLAAFLLPCAIEGIYSYDPSMSNGPANWSLVEIPGKTNECGGSSQSGIDIPTGACDKTNSNYTFEVSGLIGATGDCVSVHFIHLHSPAKL